MQSYTVLVLVALVVAVTSQEHYPGRWNKVNTHQIIDNERLFNKYVECIIGSGATSCTEDSRELRTVLPEALREVCAKCSEEQQAKIKDTLSYTCQKRPEAFAKILAKIDPENKYRPLFEAKYGKIDGAC